MTKPKYIVRVGGASTVTYLGDGGEYTLSKAKAKRFDTLPDIDVFVKDSVLYLVFTEEGLFVCTIGKTS